MSYCPDEPKDNYFLRDEVLGVRFGRGWQGGGGPPSPGSMPPTPSHLVGGEVDGAGVAVEAADGGLALRGQVVEDEEQVVGRDDVAFEAPLGPGGP